MSNAWGGRFRPHHVGLSPLDPIDFKFRDWVPYSGWPFGFKTLAPYYVRACEIMANVSCEQFDVEQHREQLLDAFHDGILKSRIYQLPDPIRFGLVYRDSLNNNKNVNALFNLRAVEIEESSSDNSVACVHAISKTGKKHRLCAKTFILACGGLETTRLLLISRGKHATGVGNEHDLVGRFYMQHPKGVHGQVILKKNCQNDFYIAPGIQENNLFRLSGVAIDPSIQQREGLLNSAIMISPLFQISGSRGAGLYHRVRANWRKRELGTTLGRLVDGAAELPLIAASAIKDSVTAAAQGKVCFRVSNNLEQVPDPESRIELSDRTDALGIPMLRTNWKIHDQDKRTLCRLHELIDQNLKRDSIGEMKSRLDPDMKHWPVSYSSSHDMGTARMHHDPRFGVTNADGRIHGLQNLYVSGAALFPTVGNTNPTLTLVALALRLADHLAERFGESQFHEHGYRSLDCDEANLR